MIDELLKRAEDWNPEAYKLTQPQLKGWFEAKKLESEPWFKSRAKGLKGIFDAQQVGQAFWFLDGWKIRPKVGILKITDVNKEQMEYRLGTSGSIFATQDYEKKQYFHVFASSGIPSNLPVVIDPHPANPIPGTVYVSSDPVFTPGTEYLRAKITIERPMLALDGYEITAPSGKTFHLLQTHREIKPDGFWKWAYAEGLAKAAQAALPSETELKARKAAEAERKGKGTCGVCFGLYAVHQGGGMVQHGYRMAGGGRGFGHEGMFKAGGDCYGVGFQPWEKSVAATEAYAKHLLRAAGQVELLIENYKAGKFQGPIHVLVSRWDGEKEVGPSHKANERWGERIETRTPDHADWGRWLDARIKKEEAYHIDLMKQVDTYNKIAAKWPEYPA